MPMRGHWYRRFVGNCGAAWVYTAIVLMTSLCGYAQTPNDEIDPSNINLPYLEFLVKLQIDSVRKTNALGPLANDGILFDASKDHADYLTRKNAGGHFQPDIPKKKTPQNRADFYGANNYYVGENIIEIFIWQNTVYKHLGKDAPTHMVRTYGQAAYDIMMGWVHSPGHFANIITSDYRITGVACSFDAKKNSIRCVQTFSKTDRNYSYQPETVKFPYAGMEDETIAALFTDGTHVPEHKRHAWGLKPVKDVYECVQKKQLMEGQEDVRLVNSGRTYGLFIGDPHLHERLFTHRKDGLALEVVSYQTYSCGNPDYYDLPSRRNGHCLFNGHVTEPVYKKKLLKVTDEDKRPKYFQSMLGSITAALDSGYEVNVLMIHKKQVYHVLHFSSVCGNWLDYRPHGKYFFDIPEVTYAPDVKPTELSFRVNFEKNKFEYSYKDLKEVLDSLEIERYTVVSANIDAYASVEGSWETNEKLFNARGESIVKALQQAQGATITKKITTRENWVVFYKQIKDGKLKITKGLDSVSLRKYVNDHAEEPAFIKALNEQRYAQVKLMVIPREMDSLAAALKEYNTSLGDWKKGDKALTDQKLLKMEQVQLFLYQRAKNSKPATDIALKLEVPDNELFASLLYNKLVFQMTSGQLNGNQSYQQMAGIAGYKNVKPELYANLSWHMINNWYDLDAKPAARNKALKTYLDKMSPGNESYWLFYHFQYAREIFDTGDWDLSKADNSLKYIWNYYTAKPMDTELRLKLAKYFIMFNWLDKAKELVAEPALAEAPNHEALILYLKIHYLRMREGKTSDYFDLLLHSSNVLNADEWCRLFKGSCNISFQIFDHEPIRSLYCKQCNELTEAGAER